MEASSNEFGKGLGSVRRSHGKGRDLSLKQSLELPTRSSSPAINLSVPYTFTPSRKKIRGEHSYSALESLFRAGFTRVLLFLPSYFSKWLQGHYTLSFNLNLPLSSES